VKARFADNAERDFKEIFIYTIGRWGESQAQKYQAVIRKSIAIIEKKPYGALTRSQDHILAGLRSIRVGKHYIFFEVEEEYITILRILHGNMDFVGHFE
jgi:toxin ParE1/3/4